ncbi:MAG: glutamate synthase subunit beta [Spirochaetaceae bacterium]|nr:glutamate synthase subunit beta [Spirochaetaceae bacterium]MCF7948572.1 glutamate synthase subunit beta [Spirochaetia bacterium]MCF7951819.1 glutamate synthase subunit beta [Spirochaetaceae bacterium]
MGELRGFLKYQQKVSGYRDVEERLKDYREVIMRLPRHELTEQAARCMDCGTPFCHSFGCTLANLIPEWNDAVYRGLWDEAYDRLELTSNFPEITGRICPAPCESSCTLSINDAPVSIKEIELAIIEHAFSQDWVVPQIPRQESGKKVAVVGSGPAGLAASQQLRRMGHQVTVYEKDSAPGGILRFGIPEFKLEKAVIDRRLNIFQQEGIEFETNVVVGEDLSARYLKRTHDAVVLTLGCRVPRPVPVPGSQSDGVYFALDYLTQATKSLYGELSPQEIVSAKDKTVLVLGGGDTGADCVGTANRQGAKKVYQFEIMPKPNKWDKTWNPEWPYYPKIFRSSSSHHEGCERRWQIKTKKLYGRGVSIEKGIFCEIQWTKDPSDRPQQQEIPGTEFTLDIDMVLIAAGFVQVEPSKLLKDFNLQLNERGTISIDENFHTNTEGVFAAGDAVSGASLVVKAMNQGRSLADKVNEYLG